MHQSPGKMIQQRPRGQRGYILIMLSLAIALMAIAAMAAAPEIAFRLRRDREEEMVHRGVQYARAIKHYYFKFHRYPTRIEELQNTNNLHFLRKRYKDPITGDEFKLVHLGDLATLLGPGFSGFGTPVNQMAGASQFGQPPPTQPGASQFLQQQGASVANTKSDPGAGAAKPDPGAGALIGENPENNKDKDKDEDSQDSPVGGVGPIVGVASKSKDKSIREYNHKDHYNKWVFIYDPASDRGMLINTPYQPAMQVQNLQQNMPGNGVNPSQSPFGGPNPNPGSFGQNPNQNPFGSGMQNPTPQNPSMPR